MWILGEQLWSSCKNTKDYYCKQKEWGEGKVGQPFAIVAIIPFKSSTKDLRGVPQTYLKESKRGEGVLKLTTKSITRTFYKFWWWECESNGNTKTMPRFYRLERREPCGQVKENPLRDNVSLLLFFLSRKSLCQTHPPSHYSPRTKLPEQATIRKWALTDFRNSFLPLMETKTQICHYYIN